MRPWKTCCDIYFKFDLIRSYKNNETKNWTFISPKFDQIHIFYWRCVRFPRRMENHWWSQPRHFGLCSSNIIHWDCKREGFREIANRKVETGGGVEEKRREKIVQIARKRKNPRTNRTIVSIRTKKGRRMEQAFRGWKILCQQWRSLQVCHPSLWWKIQRSRIIRKGVHDLWRACFERRRWLDLLLQVANHQWGITGKIEKI